MNYINVFVYAENWKNTKRFVESMMNNLLSKYISMK